jgi:hypothetical protein
LCNDNATCVCCAYFIAEVISFNLSLTESLETLGSIAIIKCNNGPLDTTQPLCSQVSVMTIRVRNQHSNSATALAAAATSVDSDSSLLTLVQQHAQHSFSPLVRLAATVASKNSNLTSNETDNLVHLQKKLREVILALEQCQHSTMIPRVKLPVPSIFEELAQQTDTIVLGDLKRYLEKYVPSQVDTYLEEIGLLSYMGETESAKEEFANNVNKYAKQWPSELMKQTKLTQSPFPKSTAKEIDFWKDFSGKLMDTKDHLETVPVMLTKLILKRTNRVSEEMIREAEADLERASLLVEGSYSFVRDFPIELVLSATDISPLLETAVTKCLRHFTKLKFASAGYDLHRASSLLDSLGSEVHHQLLALLQDSKFMKLPMEEFLLVQEQCQQLFRVWEQEFAGARNVLSDIEKRKNIKLKFKTTPEHASLQDRLRVLGKFSFAVAVRSSGSFHILCYINICVFVFVFNSGIP